MQAPPMDKASQVIDASGYFPTFHDGEILDLYLNRNSSPTEGYPTVPLTFTLHGWEMTSEKAQTNGKAEQAAPSDGDKPPN